MIFKTFDSNIDKINSKWGMFGRLFNDIGTAIRNKIISFNEEFEQTGKIIDSWKNSDSIWSRLYPSNKSIKEQLIDVDKSIPEIDESNAAKILEFVKSIEDGTNEKIKSFQELYDTDNKTNQWIAEYAQSTKDQIRSTEGVIKANQQARASEIAHNEELKNLTLSAKASKAALGALRTAMSAVVMIGISKGIELISKGIDNLVHSAEHCKEHVNELMSYYQSALDEANNTAKTVESFASKYETLSKGVNNLGQTLRLLQKNMPNTMIL